MTTAKGLIEHFPALLNRQKQVHVTLERIRAEKERIRKGTRAGGKLIILAPGGRDDCMSLFPDRLQTFELRKVEPEGFLKLDEFSIDLWKPPETTGQAGSPRFGLISHFAENAKHHEKQRADGSLHGNLIYCLTIGVNEWQMIKSFADSIIEGMAELKIAHDGFFILVIGLEGKERPNPGTCELREWAEGWRKRSRPDILVLDEPKLIQPRDIDELADLFFQKHEDRGLQMGIKNLRDKIAFDGEPLSKAKQKLWDDMWEIPNRHQLQ